jgi:hypothetical protein
VLADGTTSAAMIVSRPLSMAVAAGTCVLATLAVFIVEPGPTSTSSRETDPFGVRNHRDGKAGRKQ